MLINSGIEDILNDEKLILMVLDNAKIHHTNDIKIACEILMYLPEYSPDLNPIEDLWKNPLHIQVIMIT